MRKSRKKSLHDLEAARGRLVDLLLLYRRAGFTTQAALFRIAGCIGESPRWAYAVVYQQMTGRCPHSFDIELGAIAAKRWLADYLHAWAHDLHQEANLQEQRMREANVCGSKIVSIRANCADVPISSITSPPPSTTQAAANSLAA